jgi:hydroxymethylpyrimidine/phosphomethylpyrimidine kinase
MESTKKYHKRMPEQWLTLLVAYIQLATQYIVERVAQNIELRRLTMQTEPQLSAETEERLRKEYVEIFISEIIEAQKIVTDQFKEELATALSEQKQQIYGEVLKIDVQDYLDDQGRNAIILRDDVLAILGGEE